MESEYLRAVLGNLSKEKIRLYNYWAYELEERWFFQFMKHRGIQMPKHKKVSVYSVFGHRDVINFDKRGTKVFYTGENVHDLYTEYSDNFLSDESISLSIGFDYIENDRYFRLPLWYRTAFSPTLNEDEIVTIVKKLRFPQIYNKSLLCSLIASHDNTSEIRKQIVERFLSIDKVYCPGKLFHNDDSLYSVFNDDKKEYLQRFWFNICPENSDTNGYVTEKIFDAIESGCIPIYWGANGNPEPSVLNRDSIILWPDDFENRKIFDICSSKDRMSEFAHQARLNIDAEEVILSTLTELETRLRELFSR